MKGIKIAVSLLTVLIFVFSLFSVSFETAAETGLIRVGERTLFVDEETGEFEISDISTGKMWKSTPQNLDEIDLKNSRKRQVSSQLIVNVYDIESKTLSITAVSKSDSTVSVKTKNDTVTVYYDFEEYGFSIPLNLTLTEDGFDAFIITDDIVESNERYQIVEIMMLPYFNAGYLEEEGFMLLPDGSGAVVDFNNGKGDSVYSQPVYGRDYGIDLQYSESTTETLPIGYFGIAHSDSFSVALITDGAADASITAEGNQSNNPYNRIYPVFSVRKADLYINSGSWLDVPIYQTSVIEDVTLRVHYILCEGETPDYSDMAATLRSYMLREGIIRSAEPENSIQIDLIGGTVKKKSFLGVPVNRIQKLTDFKEALKIVENLSEQDCTDILIRYMNWNTATARSQQSPSGNLSLLGGKKAFSALKNAVQEQGGSLYLSADPIMIYKGKSIFSYFTDYAHSIFGEPIKQYPYKLNSYSKNTGGRAGYIIRNSLIGTQVKEWNAKIASLSVDGTALESTGILYTDFRDQGASRSKTEDLYKAALAGIKRGVLVDAGYCYTLQNALFLSGVPASSSGFDLENDSVPFYQMLLHAAIPYSLSPINSYPDYVISYLRAVETGAALHFVLCDAEKEELDNSEMSWLIYADCGAWINRIAQLAEQYAPLYQKVSSSAINEHRRIKEDVFLTVYENGICVAVNYSDAAVELENGMTVDARSFVSYEEGV